MFVSSMIISINSLLDQLHRDLDGHQRAGFDVALDQLAVRGARPLALLAEQIPGAQVRVA